MNNLQQKISIKLALCLAGFCFVVSGMAYGAGVRIKCNPQQIGVLCLKPHYRGVFASFRDGVTFSNGKWIPITYNDDGTVHDYSHRLWPRFYYLEMKEWKKDMYLATQ